MPKCAHRRPETQVQEIATANTNSNVYLYYYEPVVNSAHLDIVHVRVQVHDALDESNELLLPGVNVWKDLVLRGG